MKNSIIMGFFLLLVPVFGNVSIISGKFLGYVDFEGDRLFLNTIFVNTSNTEVTILDGQFTALFRVKLYNSDGTLAEQTELGKRFLLKDGEDPFTIYPYRGITVQAAGCYRFRALFDIRRYFVLDSEEYFVVLYYVMPEEWGGDPIRSERIYFTIPEEMRIGSESKMK